MVCNRSVKKSTLELSYLILVKIFLPTTRGAPISKLTDILINDILITDISAIINTDTDANTDIAAPFLIMIFSSYRWPITGGPLFMAFLCDIQA